MSEELNLFLGNPVTYLALETTEIIINFSFLFPNYAVQLKLMKIEKFCTLLSARIDALRVFSNDGWRFFLKQTLVVSKKFRAGLSIKTMSNVFLPLTPFSVSLIISC